MSRRARMCVRCIEDYADPDSLVCAMCAYEQKREDIDAKPYVAREQRQPEQIKQPGLARFKAFLKTVA